MRKTILKNVDWENDTVLSHNYERRSIFAAPMLVEYSFYDPKTNQKVKTDVLYLGATQQGSLRISLKSALEVLSKSDKVYASFEFKGITFEIRREDKYIDLLLVISEAIEFQLTVQKKLDELRNCDTADV